MVQASLAVAREQLRFTHMKYARERFPPGFFDLPARSGTQLPTEVIAEWNRSEQTTGSAAAILAPYRRRGTIVSTDSSGLTRLSRELPLVEILSLIAAPQGLIHANGKAIGGRAIGVWAADNSLMFYDESISPGAVASMLLTTMQRIANECELAIGMAAHVGDVFEISGALYGSHADRVELVAEEYSEGAEILVTDAFSAQLGDEFIREVSHKSAAAIGPVLRLTDGPHAENLEAEDFSYPAPYTTRFTDGLRDFNRTHRVSRMPVQPHRDVTVVLVEREAEERVIEEVAVLNDLAMTAAMHKVGLALLDRFAGEEIKCAGLIGIYIFGDASVAVQFAREFRDNLGARGVQTRIGIDAGPVLVFELGPDARDIAGSPVNVASKLAQDTGEPGMIQVSDTVAARASLKHERPTRVVQVSGVSLRAYDL